MQDSRIEFSPEAERRQLAEASSDAGTAAIDARLNRRNLLKASTLLGGGGLVGQVMVPSTAAAQQAAGTPPRPARRVT